MSTTSPTTESPAPVKEGDVLAAKYRVEKVLGVGGMGVVVAAHHVDLDQRVALKFLLPGASSNEELVGRFMREARASVRLKGAHVAKVLDVGRLDDGCPYIVMEFLDGRDLQAELKSRSAPLAIEDAVGYVLHAAEGLAEAHAQGIIHRDLKPGNLFLTRGVDGRPLVKVLDFGISKTIDTSAGGDALSLTRTEMLLGSPLYMSPEQMRSSKSVDERSDLWALGAIAYELLTGRVPFHAETILELCFTVAQESPTNPKELRPELPDELVDAVMRCLEKDPAKRYANVGELADALEPFGSARDRGTAERALAVLAAGKRPFTRSQSTPKLVAELAAQTGETPGEPITTAATTAPTIATSLAVGAQEIVSSAQVVVPAEGASSAWGTTQAQPPARSRRGVALLAGSVIVIAAIAGVAASRARSGDATPSALASGAEGPTDASAADLAMPAPPPAVIDSSAAIATAQPEPPPTTTAETARPPGTGVVAEPAIATVTTRPAAPVGPATGTTRRPPPVVAEPAHATATAPSARPSAAPATSGFIRVRE